MTAVLLGQRVPLARVAGYRLDVLRGTTLVPTYHPVDVVRGVPAAAPLPGERTGVAEARHHEPVLDPVHALAVLESLQVRREIGIVGELRPPGERRAGGLGVRGQQRLGLGHAAPPAIPTPIANSGLFLDPSGRCPSEWTLSVSALSTGLDRAKHPLI